MASLVTFACYYPSTSITNSSRIVCSTKPVPRKTDSVVTNKSLYAYPKRHGLCTKNVGAGHGRRGSLVILRSTVDEVSVLDPPPPPPPDNDGRKDELIASLKLKLLSIVSGLNRGLAASEDDLRKADEAAKELEVAGGLVDLSSDIDQLQGRWKLIYSSAFSSRTLGGSRPGPPTGRLLPITLGQVFQRIDVVSKDFDNIVELELGAPWPLPPVELTATLAHKFELIGSAKIKITFDKTTVKTTGNLAQLPPLDIPRIPDALRPPSNTGSGDFEVTFLDADTRITRGDRGELRVFVLS
ncbi:Plastid-lipid-associated protein 6, chloroplastic [Turnera subulata]|uniref:Plastid-lipid-associated protein 6, chloroplastic n=1 Tax=Turnera subulata TaxID=218843 RepID=A0A9Q0FV26_9ROSI|nr:Plastid-lipid-associated protein 6, chloroplastic [Turnera subulata]